MAAIGKLKDEVKQYHEGKRAPERQLDMFESLENGLDVGTTLEISAGGKVVANLKGKGKRKMAIAQDEEA